MSEENTSSLPVNEDSNEIEQKQTLNIDNEIESNETKETKFSKEKGELSSSSSISDSELCDEIDKVDKEHEIVDNAENIENSTVVGSLMQRNQLIKFIEEMGELNKVELQDKLKNLTENVLLEIIREDKLNNYLLKENDVYKSVLHEDERLQSISDTTELEEDISAHESFMLTYPDKCHFAKKKLEQSEKELTEKKDECNQELQNLNFELESLNMSLKDLQESKDKFEKNIKFGGRHPVSKIVMLEKVVKYLEDSIQRKMALANKYRVEIQGDILERNKILSQIKAQEKGLSLLDTTELEKARFEHKKSCVQLAKYKEELGKLKTKFSPILQSIAETRKDLDKEQKEMELKNTVAKLEHLKTVMQSEKTRNEEKILELKAEMRRIKLDPRRHNLPEVIEYAAAKRENAILKKAINKWRKKVEGAQQEKSLYLEALSKKNKY